MTRPTLTARLLWLVLSNLPPAVLAFLSRWFDIQFFRYVDLDGTESPPWAVVKAGHRGASIGWQHP